MRIGRRNEALKNQMENWKADRFDNLSAVFRVVARKYILNA